VKELIGVLLGYQKLKEDFKALAELALLECKVAFVLHSSILCWESIFSEMQENLRRLLL